MEQKDNEIKTIINQKNNEIKEIKQILQKKDE